MKNNVAYFGFVYSLNEEPYLRMPQTYLRQPIEIKLQTVNHLISELEKEKERLLKSLSSQNQSTQ
ncbi:MAG: hypothetical protein EXR35_02600 [Limnohabitans sp.]|nr:hypothetical protein [Limnohabitans sp.]